MTVAARREAILSLASHAGTVAVDDLAVRLGVTPQTIRKDLNLLARRALLSRVHGGAVVTSGVDNIAHAERRLVAGAAKAAIGAAVAALIPDGASLFIDIGTTTEAITRRLTGHRDLMVVTNNLNVVDILAPCGSIEVIATGGRVRQADRAIVGAPAVDFICGFKVDFAIVGASAIDADGSFLDFDGDEVRVSQAMIAHARRVILAIDASKLGRPAPVRIGDMTDIDFLVTDIRADAALRRICGQAGVRIVETGDDEPDSRRS